MSTRQKHKTFLTADLHWGHFNIIDYCSRPFYTLDQMHETMQRNWNSRVTDDDTVIVVGDWCFKNSPGGKTGEGLPITADYWASQLKGKKIFLKGNHDKNNSLVTPIAGLLLDTHGKKIYCTHKPEHANLDYEINFVGHVHDRWLIKQYGDTILFNVGVDQHRFMPITIDEALGQIQRLKRTTVIEKFYPYIGEGERHEK